MKTYVFALSVIVALSIQDVVGQEASSMFDLMKRYDQNEQNYKQLYYYNPSNMGDYSSFTISDFSLNYDKEKRDTYLLQKGSELEELRLNVNSYKKLKNNRTIWGSASYKNQLNKDIVWNNNVDLDKIGPFIMGDSVANNLKAEIYEFKGGYVKEIDRWSIGVELGYIANMAYKKRDPRPKAISSDMNFKLGAGYKITPSWKVDAFGKIHKYTQNTSIIFANQTQKAGLYQLQGLGTWNNYFSGKTFKSVYETLGLQFGLGITKKDDFYLVFTTSNDKMNKNASASITSNEGDGNKINELKSKSYEWMTAKFFNLNTSSKIAVKYSMQYMKKEGTNIYYTNNQDFLKELMRKKLYSYTDSNHRVEVLYKKEFEKSLLTLSTYWMYQSIKETVKEVNNKQNFTYNYFGVNASWLQELNSHNSIEVSYHLRFRNTTNSSNQINKSKLKESIMYWMESDYNYLKQNYVQNSISLKYSYKHSDFVPVFMTLSFNQTNFSGDKTNHFMGASLGVNF